MCFMFLCAKSAAHLRLAAIACCSGVDCGLGAGFSSLWQLIVLCIYDFCCSWPFCRCSIRCVVQTFLSATLAALWRLIWPHAPLASPTFNNKAYLIPLVNILDVAGELDLTLGLGAIILIRILFSI